MARRPYCKGSHAWVEKRGGTGWKCSNCPDVFPCRYECGHIDCQEFRGRLSKCAVCRETVPEDQQYRFGPDSKTYLAHQACSSRTKGVKVEEQDEEHEPEAAAG